MRWWNTFLAPVVPCGASTKSSTSLISTDDTYLGSVSPVHSAPRDVHPLRNLRNLVRGERHVVLVLLDSDAFVDVPGGHYIGLTHDARAELDRLRPWPHLFVRE